ncbi:hypothetical protein EST38_g1782 [Candolleomyces aberdarensis]|uniref:Uncharacterized protein n=1 Tax=Candolleomyces aberdarensis TaxID=2316362 RepID=A0A4Q2DYL2_9AGAR|nr:hypothetical protein EST38_g1782 [Candolleomyces aberdarensis]
MLALAAFEVGVTGRRKEACDDDDCECVEYVWKDVLSSRSVSEPESPVSGRAGCETVLTCRSREEDVVDAWDGDLERGDGEPSLSVEPGGVFAIVVQVVVVVFIVRIMGIGESAAAPASTWNGIAVQQRGHGFVAAAARTGAALTGKR